MNIQYSVNEKAEAMAAVASVLMSTTNQPQDRLAPALEAMVRCDERYTMVLISRNTDGSTRSMILANGKGENLYSGSWAVLPKPETLN